jgi:MFS family permease
MYGLTRAALTLLGVTLTGVLLWLATQVLPDESASRGEYWAALGFVALGGLAIAVSQLLGGWTKWGWPRISGNVFLLGFLPTLIVGGWMLAAQEPENYWLGRHVRSWSSDIGIEGLVNDLGLMIPAIALGIGLVFGLTFDTTGPRRAVRTKGVPAGGAQPVPQTTNGRERAAVSDDRTVAEDRRVRLDDEDGDGRAPSPEEAPRTGEPARK